MAVNLSDTSVIGISATSLFDLSEADQVFRAKLYEDEQTSVAEYRAYMLKHEDDLLQDDTAMPLIPSLLGLNC